MNDNAIKTPVLEDEYSIISKYSYSIFFILILATAEHVITRDVNFLFYFPFFPEICTKINYFKHNRI